MTQLRAGFSSLQGAQFINQKYGLMKRMIDLMQKLRPHSRAYLEIVPRDDGDSRDRSA